MCSNPCISTQTRRIESGGCKIPIELHYGLPHSRSRWLAGLFIVAWFLLISKAAYQASFSDDDLFNIALTYVMNVREWFEYLLSPRLSLDNLRPMGLLIYAAVARLAGLQYGPYVVVLQLLHLAVAYLLWRWLEPSARETWPAAFGIALFTGHAAILAAYWKPMYVFDVLCTLFLLLTLLAYRQGRWIWAVATFWLAYKSKETALALPAVLTLYEFLYRPEDTRKAWLRLAPFWLIALLFGIQAALRPERPNHDYDMRFSLAAIAMCAVFYAGKILFLPYGGFLLSAIPALVPRRDTLFGVAAFWLLLAPMLVFPGRLQSAYLYGPMIGLAIAAAAFAAAYPGAAAILLLLWLPINYWQVRIARQPILALGHEHGPYIRQVRDALANSAPPPPALLYDGAPPTLGNWGIDGLFRIAARSPHAAVYSATSPAGRAALRQPGAFLLHWNWQTHRLYREQFQPETPPLPYIDFATQDPLWQLDDRWYAADGPCRWTQPQASLTLRPPSGVARFRLRANFAAGQAGTLRVYTGATELLATPLGAAGWHDFDRGPFTLPNAEPVQVTLVVDPPFRRPGNSEPLGALVCAIGFQPQLPR